MNNDKWWDDDEKPPPSLRQKYDANPLRRFSRSPNPLRRFSPKFTRHSIADRSKRENSLDRQMEQRLKNLKTSKSEQQIGTVADLEERARRLKVGSSEEIPSVSNIEERLAKLRGVPVEDVRNPRVFVANQIKREPETAISLIKKARDEAAIEKRWDHSGKSRQEDLVDPELFLSESRKNHVPDDHTGEPSCSGADILWGHDTIRNLKDLRRTMKRAKQQSMEAAALARTGTNNQSVDDEMKKLMKLTRQSSVKSEKINEEMSKFWEKRMDKTSSDSGSDSEESSEVEISDEELQRVIKEAEQVENEVGETVKQSRKIGKKPSIFSRIFRS